jgi:hypothetical protein
MPSSSCPGKRIYFFLFLPHCDAKSNPLPTLLQSLPTFPGIDLQFLTVQSNPARSACVSGRASRAGLKTPLRADESVFGSRSDRGGRFKRGVRPCCNNLVADNALSLPWKMDFLSTLLGFFPVVTPWGDWLDPRIWSQPWPMRRSRTRL